MEDNSKQCTKVTNASWEEIQKCWCINCIHYADQEQICTHEEGPCCASCHFCYTEESFDDVFPACELHLHRINDPDYECCDQYNICIVDDLNQKCKECWSCKHNNKNQ